MTKQIRRWLLAQLPKWVHKGWITAETADEMRHAYQDKPQPKGPSITRVLILCIGLGLLALGVVLLFAGYWYQFSPNGRFDWTILLDTLALVVLALAIWKADARSAYAEGAAIFYMLAIAGGLLLLKNTYYTGEPYGIYVLLMVVLSLPAAYLLSSPIAMMGCLLELAWWSLSPQAITFWGGPIPAGLLYAGTIPFYLWQWKYHNQMRKRMIWLSWMYMVSLFSVFFFALAGYRAAFHLFFLTALGVGTFGIGTMLHRAAIWTLPFRIIGSIALLYTVVYGTLLGTWQQESTTYVGFLVTLFVGLFLLAVFYVLWHLLRNKKYVEALVSLGAPVIAICTLLAHVGMNVFTITLLFNLYVVILAGVLLVGGTTGGHVGRINSGIVLLLLVVATRFIDPSFTFIERGLSFVFAGLAILIVNGLYMWNKHVNKYSHYRSRLKKQDKEKADEEVL